MTEWTTEAATHRLDFNLVPDIQEQLLDVVRRSMRASGRNEPRLAAELRVAARLFDRENKQLVALRAACLVLADLVEHGWPIRIRNAALEFAGDEPVFSESFPQAGKTRQRAALQLARDRQLRQPAVHDFLRRLETPRFFAGQTLSVFSLIDDGADLADDLRAVAALPTEMAREAALAGTIEPIVEVCERDRICPHTGLLLSDIWRYFRHSWSLEYRPLPGRAIPLLIRNAARRNAPVMGIAMLASPPSRLKVRDDWIGWTPEAISESLTLQPSHESRWTDQVARALADAVQQSIAEIRFDDLGVRPDELGTPSEMTVRRLRVQADEAAEMRLEDLAKGIDQRKLPKRPDGTTDWMNAAERPLFVQKRAATLASLLQAVRVFSDLGIPSEPNALRDAVATAEGRTAIRVALTEIRKRALASVILDVNVCGGIAPYTPLLAGKLVSLLLASAEVRQAYAARYGEQVSLIASQMAGRPIKRSADPLLLTTTSLYGSHSSQYNRLHLRPTEHPEIVRDLKWLELGRTSGYGTVHFSAETVDALRRLSEMTHGLRRVNNVFGEGTSPRLRQVRDGLDLLGLDSDRLLRHRNQRIVYACELVSNVRGRLCGIEQSETEPAAPTVAAISAAWRRRWLAMRIQKPDILTQVAQLGPGTLQAELAPDRGHQLPLALQ